MTIRSTFAAKLFLLAGVLSLWGCGRTGSDNTAIVAPVPFVPDPQLTNGQPVTVPFDPASFVKKIDNPYFPLAPGTVFTYHNIFKSSTETNTIEVQRQTRTILGVATTVVHDQVFIEDGSLSEDTYDWYAQDGAGNVWYFGEDTKEYDHGTLVTTAGSWEAGQNGAKPGIIMLANPEVGVSYQQEDSPGVVADMAKVISLSETASVPFATYTSCIETTEWTPLEPGQRAHKFYARGVGIVLETSTRQGGERDELTNFVPGK